MSASGDRAARRRRRATTTASFGSSRRESHDASAFYERFVPPELSDDDDVGPPAVVDVVREHDARDMVDVPSSSVALVVTSPPYYAGKEYEQSLGEDGVPGSYFEYLALLRDVFAECRRTLEPGGRIAVNVANLGRRPYRSLSGDVTQILQDLGLLMRGEIVWWKGRAASGSCAWGTFQRPGNPVLRDVTERIVVASKGRFDRAIKPRKRLADGLPSVATISRDEFLEATTDLWEIPPESATRVGHPAPFPVELPLRLMELYTYEGDVVLDPFMGSGTTAIAAVRSGRHYIGFDTDPSYVAASRKRIADELELLGARERANGSSSVVRLPAAREDDAADDPVALAEREGKQAKELARLLLEECGFRDIRSAVRRSGLGVELSYVAHDHRGGEWGFEVAGGFTSVPSGLRRTETLWRAVAKAGVLRSGAPDLPVVLLATDMPVPGSPGSAALATVIGPDLPVFDVIDLMSETDRERLRAYAQRGRQKR